MAAGESRGDDGAEGEAKVQHQAHLRPSKELALKLKAEGEEIEQRIASHNEAKAICTIDQCGCTWQV